MYERFTEEARKVMQLANQEAVRLNHGSIAPEHIVLGLVKLGPLAPSALSEIDVRRLRLEIEKLAYCGFGRGLQPESLSPQKTTGEHPSESSLSWRWLIFSVLCGFEVLVFPLTVIAAVADDDSLLLSIPFNSVIVSAILLVGCWPHRRRASTVICAAHLTGILIATFAAAIEIESVIVSGSLLLISAIALAVTSTPPRTAPVLFALSTVMFIVISFLVITIGSFGPRQAETPLFAAMVACQILFLPLGLWLLYRPRSERKVPFRPQFRLKQPIAAMVGVCIASAAARIAYSTDDDIQVAVAVGIGTLGLAGVAAAIAAGRLAGLSGDELPLQKTKLLESI